MTIADRIDKVLGGKPMSYFELAQKLWPDARSHRYQANGGPPGCYMALSSAIRRYNFPHAGTGARGTVYPRKK